MSVLEDGTGLIHCVNPLLVQVMMEWTQQEQLHQSQQQQQARWKLLVLPAWCMFISCMAKASNCDPIFSHLLESEILECVPKAPASC